MTLHEMVMQMNVNVMVAQFIATIVLLLWYDP